MHAIFWASHHRWCVSKTLCRVKNSQTFKKVSQFLLLSVSFPCSSSTCFWTQEHSLCKGSIGNISIKSKKSVLQRLHIFTKRMNIPPTVDHSKSVLCFHQRNACLFYTRTLKWRLVTFAQQLKEYQRYFRCGDCLIFAERYYF